MAVDPEIRWYQLRQVARACVNIVHASAVLAAEVVMMAVCKLKSWILAWQFNRLQFAR